MVKGWFVIHQIRVNHTSEMEKSMHQAHGIGYAEYGRSLEKRILVEKRREKDYKNSILMAKEVDRKLV